MFFCLVAFIILNRVLFSPCSLDMDVLPRHGDLESSHDTSVATSHWDHVFGLGILSMSQISSLGQNVVNLFFFSFWRNEGRLFLRGFPANRVECCVT